MAEKEIVGLKRLRKGAGLNHTTAKPTFSCENCGCVRYIHCGCTKNLQKGKKGKK